MNRRAFLKRSLIAAPVALGAGACYGRFVERHAVEVVHHSVEIGIGKPLRVALLGDIHFDPLYEIDYLDHVVSLVQGLSPDLVLYTGDFLSKSGDRLPELLDLLGATKPALGSFGVLGNHDHGIQPDRLCAAFASCGLEMLRNRSVPLPGHDTWFLTGLESYWRGKPSTGSIGATASSARHLVLVHEPDSFDLLTDHRIALQLSGHTHGGQVRLPMVGAIHLPSWGKKYAAGLYERDGQKLYVNRGIGTVDEHYRMNCRPEITLLNLT